MSLLTQSFHQVTLKVLMMTLPRKQRLNQLRVVHAYDLALGKQQGASIQSEDEELAVLSMMDVAADVINALNTDAQYRDAPVERAEAIACAVKTALQGIPSLLKQDPEVAYQLGVVIQAELEKALRGDSRDRTEDRPGG